MVEKKKTTKKKAVKPKPIPIAVVPQTPVVLDSPPEEVLVIEETVKVPKSSRSVRILISGLTLEGKIYAAGDIVIHPSPMLIKMAEDKTTHEGQQEVMFISQEEAALGVERMLKNARMEKAAT